MAQVMEKGPVVVEATDADFEQTVVEESKRRPVVVDLWASWCGPCRTLGPILEKVAEERSGGFLLAKLDVDANPYTAGQFGVQSIPTVIAFRDGRPIDGFVGAIPEPMVNEFVDRLMPSEAELEAEEALEEELDGDLEQAESKYREALDVDPNNRDARVGLGRVLAETDREDEARQVLMPVLPDPEAERILAMLEVRGWADLDEVGTLGVGQASRGVGEVARGARRHVGRPAGRPRCASGDARGLQGAGRGRGERARARVPAQAGGRPVLMPRDTHDRIREFWDEDSHTYDSTPSHAISDPLEAAAWRQALGEALPEPGAAVLDVGAGTGALSLLAAELGYEVTALDLSPGMLGRAEIKAKERGLDERMRFVVGSAMEPPEGPFDAVMERHLLWTMPDPVGALGRWRQVAGRLVLFEGIWGQQDLAQRAKDTAADILRRILRTPDDHHAPYPQEVLAELPLARLPSPAPLLDAVVEAGWSAVRIKRLRDVEWAAKLHGPRPLGWLEHRTRYAIVASA